MPTLFWFLPMFSKLRGIFNQYLAMYSYLASFFTVLYIFLNRTLGNLVYAEINSIFIIPRCTEENEHFCNYKKPLKGSLCIKELSRNKSRYSHIVFCFSKGIQPSNKFLYYLKSLVTFAKKTNYTKRQQKDFMYFKKLKRIISKSQGETLWKILCSFFKNQRFCKILFLSSLLRCQPTIDWMNNDEKYFFSWTKDMTYPKTSFDAWNFSIQILEWKSYSFSKCTKR